MKRFLLFVPLVILALVPVSAQEQDKLPQVKTAAGVKFTGYKPPTPAQRAASQAVSQARHGARIAMQAKFQEIPPAFDCKAKGWVPPTGDQGNCGSCYLYSTARTMTCAYIKAGYGKADGSFAMSVQFGMDCHNFGGCGGGWGVEVIDWACSNGWYAEKWVDLNGATHNDYPGYEARSRSCRKVAGAKVWQPASWGYINNDGHFDVTAMKAAMFNYGPLNFALDAGGQFGSGTGTITSLGSGIDHEIIAVAYDDNHDNGNGTKGAVLFNNQWSEDWGNGGYRWCSYNACKRCVDWFFVTATPLPPPPEPPTPPGPGPGPSPTPGGTITLSQALPAGTFGIVLPGQEVNPAGTQARYDALVKQVQQMQAVIDGKKAEPTDDGQTKEPPAIEKKETPKPPEPKEEKKQDARDTVFQIDMTFAEWQDEARKSSRPLVVGIGCDPPLEDWLSFRVEPPWGDFTAKGIVVFWNENGVLWRSRTLSTSASVTAIERSMGIVRDKRDPKPYPKKAA